MEFVSDANKPVAQNISTTDDLGSFCVDKEHCESAADKAVIVDNLGDDLSKALRVQDSSEAPESSPLQDTADAEGGKRHAKDTADEDVSTMTKSFSKSATFPSTSAFPHSCVSEDNDELGSEIHANNSACDSIPRSLSLPSPLKLVSAMKGSREKQGGSPKKLTVKWAADVYDPTPSIVSHTLKGKSKKQPKFDKKSGKGKQKGSKASRGNNGKDKKRKITGNSKRCYRPLDANENLVSFSDCSEDFDVSSAYGSSRFLRNSLNKYAHCDRGSLTSAVCLTFV